MWWYSFDPSDPPRVVRTPYVRTMIPGAPTVTEIVGALAKAGVAASPFEDGASIRLEIPKDRVTTKAKNEMVELTMRLALDRRRFLLANVTALVSQGASDGLTGNDQLQVALKEVDRLTDDKISRIDAM